MKRIYWIPTLAMAAALMAGCQTTTPNQQRAASQQAAAQNAAAPVSATPVDFRLAQTTPAQGLEELKLADGSLWILAQPVLNRSDLSTVEPRQTAQGQFYIRFGFNQTGARKLAEISNKYPGKLLVLTINNELVAAPQLQRGITTGVLDVPFASHAQAVNAARAIAD